MAYVFNKLNSQLDNDEDKKKQDIFAQEGPQGFGLTNAPPQQQQPETKTETGISLTSNTPAPTEGTATVKPTGKAASPMGATEKRQETLDRQRTELPQGLQFLGKSLTEKEGSLDPAKETYLSEFNQTNFGLDPETISSAVSGDTEARAKVAGLLSKGTPGLIPEAFDAPDVSTPIIDQIQTAGGLAQYLRRQAGPQYTAGEGGFDTASLLRDPTFLAGRAELARRSKALGDEALGLETDLGGIASDILAANLSDAQEDTRTGLGGIWTDIEQAIEDERIRKQADLDALVDQSGILAQDPAALIRRQLADATPDELNLDDLILSQKLGIDPTTFLDLRDSPITAGEVVTPEQIEQFQAIADLLGEGSGDILTRTDSDPFSSFKGSAYEDALLEAAINERNRLDAAAAAAAAAEEEEEEEEEEEPVDEENIIVGKPPIKPTYNAPDPKDRIDNSAVLDKTEPASQEALGGKYAGTGLNIPGYTGERMNPEAGSIDELPTAEVDPTVGYKGSLNIPVGFDSGVADNPIQGEALHQTLGGGGPNVNAGMSPFSSGGPAVVSKGITTIQDLIDATGAGQTGDHQGIGYQPPPSQPRSLNSGIMQLTSSPPPDYPFPNLDEYFNGGRY